MEQITVESIPILVGHEDDGRWWADIALMPGVMAYGATRESAIAAVRALALRVAADCIDHGEEIPEPFHQGLFGGMSHWKSVKAKQLLSALLRIGWEVAWQKGSHRQLKRTAWAGPSLQLQRRHCIVASCPPPPPTETRSPPSPASASPDSSFPERCRRAGGTA